MDPLDDLASYVRSAEMERFVWSKPRFKSREEMEEDEEERRQAEDEAYTALSL